MESCGHTFVCPTRGVGREAFGDEDETTDTIQKKKTPGQQSTSACVPDIPSAAQLLWRHGLLSLFGEFGFLPRPGHAYEISIPPFVAASAVTDACWLDSDFCETFEHYDCTPLWRRPPLSRENGLMRQGVWMVTMVVIMMVLDLDGGRGLPEEERESRSGSSAGTRSIRYRALPVEL